jgi:valyl-tRNA synthetase
MFFGLAQAPDREMQAAQSASLRRDIAEQYGVDAVRFRTADALVAAGDPMADTGLSVVTIQDINQSINRVRFSLTRRIFRDSSRACKKTMLENWITPLLKRFAYAR